MRTGMVSPTYETFRRNRTGSAYHRQFGIAGKDQAHLHRRIVVVLGVKLDRFGAGTTGDAAISTAALGSIGGGISPLVRSLGFHVVRRLVIWAHNL